jgi:hypothetical protein
LEILWLGFAPGCIFAKQPLANPKTIAHKVQDYSALVIGVFSGGFPTFIIDLVKWSTALEPLHAAFSAEFVWDLQQNVMNVMNVVVSLPGLQHVDATKVKLGRT